MSDADDALAYIFAALNPRVCAKRGLNEYQREFETYKLQEKAVILGGPVVDLKPSEYTVNGSRRTRISNRLLP